MFSEPQIFGWSCVRALVMTEQLRRPTPELTHALGELCARLVMTEQLRRPTPELPHALGELMFALGDAGAAAAPHTGAVVHSKDAIAVFIWKYGSYCGVPIPEQSRMPYDGVAIYAQC